jgi:AcrR family transcriptional regulator
VARIASATRLHAIVSAATDVFGRVGYQRTRTADVAAAAGISSGSLFTYVQTKEALFHLVFVNGFGARDADVATLPVPSPAPGETLALIEKGLRKFPVPRLSSALKTTEPDDVAEELRAIIAERYDMLEQLWPVLAVIEQCAVDLPDLEAFYYGRVRVGYHHRLARYLDARTRAGYLCAMPDVDAAARLISESIAWFAWHRREGRDAHDYDDATARETVLDFATSALVRPRKR